MGARVCVERAKMLGDIGKKYANLRDTVSRQPHMLRCIKCGFLAISAFHWLPVESICISRCLIHIFPLKWTHLHGIYTINCNNRIGKSLNPYYPQTHSHALIHTSTHTHTSAHICMQMPIYLCMWLVTIRWTPFVCLITCCLGIVGSVLRIMVFNGKQTPLMCIPCLFLICSWFGWSFIDRLGWIVGDKPNSQQFVFPSFR